MLRNAVDTYKYSKEACYKTSTCPCIHPRRKKFDLRVHGRRMQGVSCSLPRSTSNIMSDAVANCASRISNVIVTYANLHISQPMLYRFTSYGPPGKKQALAMLTCCRVAPLWTARDNRQCPCGDDSLLNLCNAFAPSIVLPNNSNPELWRMCLPLYCALPMCMPELSVVSSGPIRIAYNVSLRVAIVCLLFDAPAQFPAKQL